MERKLTIFVILILAFVTAFSMGVLAFHPDLHGEILAYYGLEEEVVEVAAIVDSTQLLKDSTGKSHSMRLEFPESTNLKKIEIESDIKDRLISISSEGIGKGYPVDYPVVSETDDILEVDYKNHLRTGVVTVLFDRAMEFEKTIEGQFLYLDFLTPKEKYEHVVVLDAGHGGSDPGAVFKEDYEKDINLELVLKLKDILKDEGIGLYLTKEEDKYMNPPTRAQFANSIEPDLFLSIHLNSTASGRASKVRGSEVMYYSKEETGTSKELAKKLSKAISEALDTQDRGILVGDNIHVLREIKAPAVLCEIGFMTNKEELKKMKDKEYQEKIVEAIAETIMEEIK